MDFAEVMEGFVLNPSEETLAPPQAEIMGAENFDPLVLLEPQVSPLIASGNYQAAVDAVWRMMPGGVSKSYGTWDVGLQLSPDGR